MNNNNDFLNISQGINTQINSSNNSINIFDSQEEKNSTIESHIIHREIGLNDVETLWEVKKNDEFFYNINSKIKMERNLVREDYTLDHLYSLLDQLIFSLPNIELAWGIIKKAISNKIKIGIIGDYDVDGISSTALLYKFLKNIGHPAVFFIGDRQDGYGPTEKAFQFLRDNGAKLFMILDSGTVCKDLLDLQQEDIIVLDHHIPDENHLPTNAIIINPQLTNHPMAHCCTGGLVFAFIYSLKNWIEEEQNIFIDYNPLVAIAGLTTVCDVMLLTELNAIYVQLTVKAIRNNQCPMIFNYLIHNKIGKKLEEFDEEDLGFFIGPHINSIGRLCSNKIIHQLVYSISSNIIFPLEKKDKLSVLSEEDYGRIALEDKNIEEFTLCMEKTFFPNGIIESDYYTIEFIKYIGNLMINLNTIRKERQKILIREIAEDKLLIEKNKTREIFCFSSKLISSFLGIVGIVAAKICEDFHKPAFIGIALGDKIKGSIRSIEGVNVGLMMIACKEKSIIVDGGGHSKAGGFTVKIDKWEEFIDFCNEFTEICLANQSKQKIIPVDYILSINGLNKNLMEDLNYLRPFGEGNKKLNILFVNCNVTKAVAIANQHLMLNIEVDQIRWDNKKKNVSCWGFFYKRNKKLMELLNILQKNRGIILDIIGTISNVNNIHLIDFRII